MKRGFSEEAVPAQIFCAGALLAIGASAQLVSTPTAAGLGVSGLGFLLAWLLLQGSRIAWVVTLASSLAQIVVYLVDVEYLLATLLGGVIAVLLIAPASFRFIWSRRKSAKKRSGGGALRARIEETGYRVLARIAGWQVDSAREQPHQRRHLGLLTWRLGVGALLLLIPVALTHRWDKQHHNHNRFVDVLAEVVWAIWAVDVLALLLVGLFAMAFRLGASSAQSKEQNGKNINA